MLRSIGLQIKQPLIVIMYVSPLPGCVDDVSSVECVLALLVVSGLTVHKRPDICELTKGRLSVAYSIL